MFVPVHFGCGKNSINMGDRDRKRKNVRVRERDRDREIERAQVLWFQVIKNEPKSDAHNFFPQGPKDISITSTSLRSSWFQYHNPKTWAVV